MAMRCRALKGTAGAVELFTGRIGIIIPAYNEADHLPGVLTGCRAVNPAVVVVVDDCSTDDTSRVMAAELRRQGAERFPMHYLRNERNLGKQGSVRRGLRLLREMELDGVALIDGDGQHDPRELPRLASALSVQHFVIGARGQQQMPLHRRLSNGLVNLGYWLIGGINFVDVQSGLRVYRKELADLLATQLSSGGGYNLEHESLALLASYSQQSDQLLEIGIAEASCAYGAAKSSMRPGHILQLAGETVRQALRIRLVLLAAPSEVGQ